MVSRLRVLVLVAMLAAGVWSFLVYPRGSSSAQWVLIYALQIVGLLLLGIAAEVDERKPPAEPRRAPPQVLAPLVPGTGRGILFVILTLLVALGSFLAARLVHDPDGPLFGDDDPTQLATICLFALAYCLVPASFARRWPQGAPRFVRLVGLTLSGLLLFLIFGILAATGLPTWIEQTLRPLVFPPMLLEDVKQDGGWSKGGWVPFLVLCSVVGILLVANLPRMLRGIVELARARRAASQPVA
jgi:hypothetical protein